ncbi:MAG: PhzF family phenazine biosynthesis protein [Candidatus Krumholzibacteria bacterium]|nr:PhzF family phenazine biosynthesis protein [Candidatus Krumholzibacteria bacterium]
MSENIFTVDSFTEKPFAGNPAGVCILPGPRDEGWMQSIAREMNLSETAFLYRGKDGYNLRWFTPVAEVELCGHATLASAHILWETGDLAPKAQARFQTKSGLLTAARSGGLIELDFPAKPAEPADAPDGLIEALGVEPRYIGRNAFDYLVEVESQEIVRDCAPDIASLKKIRARGVIVTAAASSAGFDFVSRFFAPAVGVDEDPVTGSAHCCLGPYWGAKLGKTEMKAYQASARGGVVRVRLAEDRVFLGGHAVTILRGELAV